uniref:Bm1123 n=1 Tax=Brugia malayi TaxID=6279 RepID=A0A1I9G6E3_BRUMA|nr:Bm1123 [Brugia malayi]
MPLYPTLEDLLVDQYQYQKYGSCSDHSSQPFHSCAEPSAPVFESDAPIPGQIYETVDENIISAGSFNSLILYIDKYYLSNVLDQSFHLLVLV